MSITRFLLSNAETGTYRSNNCGNFPLSDSTPRCEDVTYRELYWLPYQKHLILPAVAPHQTEKTGMRETTDSLYQWLDRRERLLHEMNIKERRFAFSVPGEKDGLSLGNYYDRLIRQPWILEERLNLPSLVLIFWLRWIGTSQSRRDCRWIRLGSGRRRRRMSGFFESGEIGCSMIPNGGRSRRLMLKGIHPTRSVSSVRR